MTASEPRPSVGPPPIAQAPRSAAQRALDVLVYLPAGAFLAALEDVSETVAIGHARVDQELRNAKFVGRLAVELGWRQVREQFQPLTDERSSEKGEGARGDDLPGGEAESPEPRRIGRVSTGQREPHRAPRSGPRAARPHPTAASRDPEVDRAIPDYDILAASQVVRRLDGLGHDELRAVVRHERATRGRRTILHRAEQLLGPRPRDRTPRDPAVDGPRGGTA